MIAIINSVLSLAVYLRIVVPMYQQAESNKTMVVAETPLVKQVWLAGLIINAFDRAGCTGVIGEYFNFMRKNK